LPGRRAFVAGSVALVGFPLLASRAPEPPKVGAIRWPGLGHDLHGYMAVPARAHGPQPAILVFPDGEADAFSLGLTDALALAGFVACVAKAPLSFEEAAATLRWLGTNHYATGKVGGVAMGAAAAMAQRIASARLLDCAVLFDGKEGAAETTGLLRLPTLAATTDAAVYAATWRRAIAFLAHHLCADQVRSSR